MIRISLKSLSLWLAGLACLLSSPAGADQITYQMVTVGNPGNGTDTSGRPNTAGFGSVNYSYQIGKYDVTIGQYTAFLNAVDPTGANPNGIWNDQMQFNNNIAGIEVDIDEADVGSKYSVTGPVGTEHGQSGANRPITYVSWFSAARFANWMTNGQGGPGTTEDGAYTLNGATSGNAVAANPGAAFRLPTENEWYKAAYYSPTLNSGAGGYYAYATQSDTDPGNQIGSTANQANYFTGAGYSVTQSTDSDPNQNYLTDVGAFTNSASFYGTFDQSGNVYQWNDLDGLAPSGSSRGLRGGFWSNSSPFVLSSSYSISLVPSLEHGTIGFRLASPAASSVPEIDPSSLGSVLALVMGSLGLLERRRLKAA